MKISDEFIHTADDHPDFLWKTHRWWNLHDPILNNPHVKVVISKSHVILAGSFKRKGDVVGLAGHHASQIYSWWSTRRGTKCFNFIRKCPKMWAAKYWVFLDNIGQWLCSSNYHVFSDIKEYVYNYN
jgi:hypothetical protein